MDLIHGRRSFLRGTLLFSVSTLLPSSGLALTASPRHRVIIDNDFSGDPDGLFQLAHHLASPSTFIPFVIGSHIHTGDFLDPSTDQPANAVRCATELMSKMRLDRRPDVIAGRRAALKQGARAESTPAVRRIIGEALREDTHLPLFYAAGAGLTDLAEAIRVEPRIASKLKLLWIGGPEYQPLEPTTPTSGSAEYNLSIDLSAAQAIFNDSAIEIWQVPRNTYRRMLVSHAELESGLRGGGALGEYLLDQLERIIHRLNIPLGETYILGDSPLVTLTSLQSAFEPDASSSDYIIRSTPGIDDRGNYQDIDGARPMRVYTSIDTRLTFADMFAKLRAASI